MAYRIHRADARGKAEHGWLHSRFSFSFDHYSDVDRMGFGALRVINDDIIEPSKGFGMHPHRDMEIVTIMLEGALEHKDSMGNRGIIKAGELQYMSAASGVHHSEFNASSSKQAKLLQIWIYPSQKGGTPCYDKRDFNPKSGRDHWVTLVSGDGHDGSIAIRQDASIDTVTLTQNATIALPKCSENRGQLLFVVEGNVEIAEDILHVRDEMQITDSASYAARALQESKLLLFEVPL